MQTSQINIQHDTTQLHYMIDLSDARDQLQATHGYYNYFMTHDSVQFVKNSYNPNSYIYNMQRNINSWSVVDEYCTNYYMPIIIKQRNVTVYIPRYSIESFFENNYSSDESMPFSNIKYILTSYIYIAGIKLILGSYLFDNKSLVAPDTRIKNNGEEYYMCATFNIIDPISITYDDDWKDFRVDRCGELPYTNNTGSVLHIELEPVMESSVKGEYIKVNGFDVGATSILFQHNLMDFLNLSLEFNGDATLRLDFNEVYEKDLTTYLAETYNMWKKDEEGNYLDANGNIVEQDATTGIIDEARLVPTSYRVIYELVIKDEDNLYDYQDFITSEKSEHTFEKSLIEHEWDWWKEGLKMQGSVEIYDTEVEDIEELKETQVPIIILMSNEIPLTRDIFKYLVPTKIAGDLKNINLNKVDMNNYNVSVVNKIHKNIVKVNRPEDYKSNIIKPMFYTSRPLNDIIVHPAVSENIGLNLNSYKSKVEIFYIRIEGKDFIEIGRTKTDVIFNIDGNQLPNEVTSGIFYILNQDYELVTTGKYTYEQ